MRIVISGFDLEPFQAVDPSFDQQGFLGRAESVVTLLHAARASGDLRRARHVMSDDYSARVNSELDAMRAAGEREVFDGVTVTEASVLSATSSQGVDTCGAYFEFSGRAFVAGRDGKAVRGDDRSRSWAEEWWFQRPSQVSAPTTEVALDRCSNCGAPADAAEGHACTYCGTRLGDPSGWVLTRVVATDARPDLASVAKRSSRVGLIVTLAILLVVGGIVAATVMMVSDVTDTVTNAIDDVTGTTIEIPDIDVPGGPTGETPSTFVTPVADPRIKAPVNDVAGALAAVQAAAGRPLLFSQIHLYPDGRIMFEVQAVDDPTSADYWTWRGGSVEGPEQGPGSMTPDRFFSLDGIDLTRLEALSNEAIGATGIADGVVDSPYLVAIAGGPRWYIPVTSEARSTNTKTYRVHPDGSGAEIF